MELMQPKRLGHRLLLSLARMVTTKLVFRPAGSIGLGAFWQEAFHAKGVKGSAVVADSASRHFSKSFPPRSLGNSFVAVFAGPEGTSVDASIFGDVDANDFRADATALRQVNEVYAESCLDEEELRSWPAQPGVPQALLSSILAVPGPDVDVEDEAPGTAGPAHMTSGHGRGNMRKLWCRHGSLRGMPLLVKKIQCRCCGRCSARSSKRLLRWRRDPRPGA